MGLDQYAYAVSKRSVANKEFDFNLSERVKRQKLGYWRNHWHLCDWFAKLYYKKGGKKGPKKRCSVCLQLHERDLDALERAVHKKVLYGYTWFAELHTIRERRDESYFIKRVLHTTIYARITRRADDV